MISLPGDPQVMVHGRTKLGWSQAVFLLGLWVLGCQAFPLAPFQPEKTDRPLPKDPAIGPGFPNKHTQRVSQFVFFHDFDLPRNTTLFQEVSRLRDQVYKELQLPPSTALVHVYLFEDRDKYEHFMQQKYPDLPKRRAFFVAQPRRLGGTEDLMVFTYWGERVQQDLRHELTHAILHCVLQDVPLWLDEGLAEYFEMPPSWNGVNYQHLEQLRRGPMSQAKLDLDRLEHLTDVQQMTPAEYRESWAWVHFMLRGSAPARKTLIGYLHELRSSSKAGSLKTRLLQHHPGLNQSLEKHLEEIDLNRVRTISATK